MKRAERRTRSDTSSDTSSSETSDSSSESSSSSEDEVQVAKPLFVPKHKRKSVLAEVTKQEKEEARHQREEERTKRRVVESRAMVAKQVSAVQSEARDSDEDDEEGGGATNDMPIDDDDVDREQERDAWEMRELERLLIALDEVKRWEAEKLEYERRRQMTDAECLAEDKKSGRYQRPGAARQTESGSNVGKYSQRFFHRGAYYQEADEWDESDVRHKAVEYAKAATGEDKMDKSLLPEIMRVNKFGMARQNRRYKGLSKEDTTDQTSQVLPIVRKQANRG